MIGLHTNEHGWRLARTWLVIAVCVVLIVAGVHALSLTLADLVSN